MGSCFDVTCRLHGFSLFSRPEGDLGSLGLGERRFRVISNGRGGKLNFVGEVSLMPELLSLGDAH